MEYADGVEGAGEGGMWEVCDRRGMAMKRSGFCAILLSMVADGVWESETRLGLLVDFVDSRASTTRRLLRR